MQNEEVKSVGSNLDVCKDCNSINCSGCKDSDVSQNSEVKCKGCDNIQCSCHSPTLTGVVEDKGA